MAKKQGHKKLKFKKKNGETMTHKDTIPGVDYDVLNDYIQDKENNKEETDVFEEEQPLYHVGESVVENVEENKINEEYKRIDEEDKYDKMEGVSKEPKEDDTEQVIDQLIDSFNDEILPEGKQILKEITEEKEEDQEETRVRPIREQRQPERLTYAQKVISDIEKAREAELNQTTTCGTLRLEKLAFQQVIKEQEHNLFAQTVRKMTGIYYIGHESIVMAQLMEEISTRYNLMTQHMLHKGLRLFRERGIKAIGKEVGQLHD